MIFITGGANQGKRNYAFERYALSEEGIFDCNQYEIKNQTAFTQVSCIINLQLLAKQLEEKQLIDLVKTIISQNPDIIMIMDEVGCGIVPLEKADRDYREKVGHLGCFIAAQADCVIRVICGVGQKIK